MNIGLRIDVDTFRGTRDGLPTLCRILSERGIRASMLLTAGPDNMGRHVRRLIRPAFLAKMIRSGATSLYGWDILLRGTLWPGPIIHRKLAAQFRDVAKDGHEIGVHAWDHHWWQTHAHCVPIDRLRQEIRQAHEAIADVTGQAPTCAAAPGWRCTEAMLESRNDFGYAWASDARGVGVFQPIAGPPQICVNLPTWDESVGRDGVHHEHYNDHVLQSLRRDGSDVYTIHAEYEGGVGASQFAALLDRASAEGLRWAPLGEMIPAEIPTGRMQEGQVPGREGWLAVRGAA